MNINRSDSLSPDLVLLSHTGQGKAHFMHPPTLHNCLNGSWLNTRIFSPFRKHLWTKRDLAIKSFPILKLLKQQLGGQNGHASGREITPQALLFSLTATSRSRIVSSNFPPKRAGWKHKLREDLLEIKSRTQDPEDGWL